MYDYICMLQVFTIQEIIYVHVHVYDPMNEEELISVIQKEVSNFLFVRGKVTSFQINLSY